MESAYGKGVIFLSRLIREANDLLKSGGFEYAFCGGQAIDLFLGYESRVHGDIDISSYWKDSDRIILYIQSQGFFVYEMLGGGRAHRITDVSKQMYEKRNIFCYKENCPLVKTYPHDENDCCRISPLRSVCSINLRIRNVRAACLLQVV